MSLPEGVFLSSGVTDNVGCPEHEGIVAPLNVRDMQWEKIKQLRLDQRLCSVFNSKAEYVKSQDQVIGSPISRWSLRGDAGPS